MPSQLLNSQLAEIELFDEAMPLLTLNTAGDLEHLRLKTDAYIAAINQSVQLF
tara:strand:- start:7375 stop:7533 length:159 start_codon:yes stop_codon:yes gene_type:complete